jgi:hypothetical protein
VIERARCRFCLDNLVLNPFVGEWQSVQQTICAVSENDWKTHEPLTLHGPDEVIRVVGELMDVVNE